MSLADEFAVARERVVAGVPQRELAKAAEELSRSYRDGRSRPKLDSTHRLAYLASRAPATFAVLSRVFTEVRLRVTAFNPKSLLDLGSGPGTAMWAAFETFADLSKATLVEDSPEWVSIGKSIADSATDERIRSAEWLQASVFGPLPERDADLVTLSYVLNELPANQRSQVVAEAWRRTRGVFVFVEPGTPAGFGHVRDVRQQLLLSGAHIAAPCPHALECPMREGDWCHFAERLQRSTAHRSAKSAELGYEDEKYSYVIFSRTPALMAATRILRHPRKHSGHVELELCTPGGLKRETVSKKQGERYKRGRNAEWGDAFE